MRALNFLSHGPMLLRILAVTCTARRSSGAELPPYSLGCAVIRSKV